MAVSSTELQLIVNGRNNAKAAMAEVQADAKAIKTEAQAAGAAMEQQSQKTQQWSESQLKAMERNRLKLIEYNGLNKEAGAIATTAGEQAVTAAVKTGDALAEATKKGGEFTGLLSDIKGKIGEVIGEVTGLSKVRAGINEIGEATGLTVAALGPLNSALAVGGAAMAGWKIGRFIADLTGADKAVEQLALRLEGFPAKAAAAGAAQDVIANAIRNGAAAGIKYGDAVKYMNAVEAIRRSKFSEDLDLQKGRITAELYLGRITQEQANVERAQIDVQKNVNNVRRDAVSIDAIRTLSLRRYHDELQAAGVKESELIDLIQNSPATFAMYVRQVGLSSETVQILKDKVEAAGKASKAHEEQIKRETKALEERIKAMDKNEEMNAKAAKSTVAGPQNVLEMLGIQMGNIQLESKQTTGLKGFSGMAPDLSEQARKHMQSLTTEAKTFQDVLEGTFKNLPSLITAAFTGGASLKGALSGFATQLSAGLFGGEGDKAGPLAFITKGLTSKVSGFFGGGGIGKALGGIAGGLLPGVGGLAVQGISSLFGKLFGGNKEYASVKDERAKFEADAGGSQSLIAQAVAAGPAAEAALKKVWDTKNLQAYKQAVSELTAELNKHTAEIEKGNATLAKYGITWKQMGDAAKEAHITDTTKTLLEDFAELQKKGVGNVDIIKAMAGEFSQLYQDIVTTGKEAPASLEEIFKPLIEMGLLVDENGDKITDLSQIKFAGLAEAAKKAARDAKDALEGISRTQVEPVKIGYRFEAENSLPDGSGGDTGGSPDDMGRAAAGIFASGKQGVATWFGEGGEPEVGGPASFFRRIFEAIGIGNSPVGGGANGNPMVLNFNITAMSAADMVDTIKNDVLPIITDVIGQNTRGARTGLRNALGVTG